LNPLIRPEEVLPSITNHDRNGNIKKTFHLCLISKLETGPDSLWICSSEPEPTHSERRAHQLKVGNTEAPQLLGITRVNPGYRTLSTRNNALFSMLDLFIFRIYKFSNGKRLSVLVGSRF
jgi:hypothetical protein